MNHVFLLASELAHYSPLPFFLSSHSIHYSSSCAFTDDITLVIFTCCTMLHCSTFMVRFRFCMPQVYMAAKDSSNKCWNTVTSWWLRVFSHASNTGRQSRPDELMYTYHTQYKIGYQLKLEPSYVFGFEKNCYFLSVSAGTRNPWNQLNIGSSTVNLWTQEGEGPCCEYTLRKHSWQEFPYSVMEAQQACSLFTGS